MVDFHRVLDNEQEVTSVTTSSSLDIEAAHKQFQPYLDEIEKVKTVALNHEIVDDQTNAIAIDLVAQIKTLAKKLETKRKEIVAEPNKFVRQVNSFCKKFSEPLTAAEKALKTKIGQYQYRLELERRKKEEEIRKKNEELQRKLEEEAKKVGVEAPKITPLPASKSPDERVVRTDTGASAHTRKTWKAEIVDPGKVPREYCEPSMKLINNAVKMGVREIPGVRIYQDVQAIVRP